MTIPLAFAPVIAFSLVDRLIGPIEGSSLALLVRDQMTRGHTPEILEIGTSILFCGLALPCWAVGHPFRGSILHPSRLRTGWYPDPVGGRTTPA